MTDDVRERAREGYEMACGIVGRALFGLRSKLRAVGLDDEDAEQEAWAIVLECCDKIDEATTKAQRGAFVRTCVTQGLQQIVVHRSRQCRWGEQLCLPLDMVGGDESEPWVEEIEGPAVDFDGYVEGRRIARLAWRIAKDDTERQIALRFELDETRTEMAARLGCSRQNIENIERRLFARVREAA